MNNFICACGRMMSDDEMIIQGYSPNIKYRRYDITCPCGIQTIRHYYKNNDEKKNEHTTTE